MKKLMGIILSGASIIILMTFFLYYKKKQYALKTVETFEILEQKLPILDEHSLVIFDTGSVLFTKADPWERGYKKERKKALTRNTLNNKGTPLYEQLDPETRVRLNAIYKQAIQRELIDKNIPNLIKKLRKKGVKVIVLTRFMTAKVGSTNMEDVRINNLRSSGIDLQDVFTHYSPLTFDHFSHEEGTPLFKDGVLFTTADTPKGVLLVAFLKKIAWHPKLVIMFDNKTKNLTSVGDVLKKMHIPFEGYEYTGNALLPHFFDKELAEFQMRYLFENEKWLPSDQARKLMNFHMD